MPPKRKAPPKLSGLVGSDDEEIMETTAKEPETSNEPPAKRRRGRPRTSHENVTEIKSTKPATRTKKQQPAANEPEAPTDKKSTRRGRPRGSRAAQDAEMPAQEAMEETIPEYDSVHDEKGEPPTINESSKQPPKAAKAKAAAPTRGRGRGRAVSAQLHTDGGFEFTPSSARQGDHHVADKEQAASPLGHMETREGEDPEVEDSHPIEEPATELVDETPSYKHKAASPVKSGRSRLSILRNPQDSSPRKRKLGGIGGTDSEHGGDPELRRRLGDMAKKHEALESKFRNLREIGVVEANTNMEKLRKQNENIVTASNQMIASLKTELEAQRKLGLQSRGLQKQLKERDDELARLKSETDEAKTQLASAQSEVKALQTKLAAARNTAASLEGAVAKVPGSAIKGGVVNRANAAASAEVAQASQIAQLKEDLYSDLTGLIVRDVKNRDSEHVYDCIQTGVNGTLHFHLVVPKASGAYDQAEFQYLPLLDSNRDRDLVNMLPDFLTVDITFVRGQAAKFYTRVIDVLTKRRSLPAQ